MAPLDGPQPQPPAERCTEGMSGGKTHSFNLCTCETGGACWSVPICVEIRIMRRAGTPWGGVTAPLYPRSLRLAPMYRCLRFGLALALSALALSIQSPKGLAHACMGGRFMSTRSDPSAGANSVSSNRRESLEALPELK